MPFHPFSTVLDELMFYDMLNKSNLFRWEWIWKHDSHNAWLRVVFAYLTDVTGMCFNRPDNSNRVRRPQCTHLKSTHGLKFMLSVPPLKRPEEVQEMYEKGMFLVRRGP